MAGRGDAAAHACFLRRALEIVDLDGLPVAELERVLGSVAQALRPVADVQRPLLAQLYRSRLLKRLAERVGTALAAGRHLAGDVVARRVERDVLNSQGCTQAAWLNRIPGAAWALLGLIAIFANFLMGYRERSTGMFALLALPVVVSIAFFLLADIDSPNGGGVIHIAPHNLISMSQSMAKQ